MGPVIIRAQIAHVCCPSCFYTYQSMQGLITTSLRVPVFICLLSCKSFFYRNSYQKTRELWRNAALLLHSLFNILCSLLWVCSQKKKNVLALLSVQPFLHSLADSQMQNKCQLYHLNKENQTFVTRAFFFDWLQQLLTMKPVAHTAKGYCERWAPIKKINK